MFETKIALVVRDDLAIWQKLNVVAFLTSGIVGATAGLLGEPYLDADGNTYNALIIQPVIVLAADEAAMKAIFGRAREREISLSLYTREMFSTGHDAANREAVRHVAASDLDVVGLAMRADRKLVDRVTKGARMHP